MPPTSSFQTIFFSEHFYAILLIVLFAVYIYAMACYHGIRSFIGLKKSARKYFMMGGFPVMLFMKTLFNDEGNRHRVEALQYGVAFVALMIMPKLLNWLYAYFGTP